MLSGKKSQAACLYTYKFNLIFIERMKKTDRITSASHAGNKVIRKPFFRLEYLLSSLFAYYRLKISYHHRIRVRTDYGADYIMSSPYIGDPIAECFVYRVFKRLRTALDGYDPGAQEFHPEYVKGLALYIFFAHI